MKLPGAKESALRLATNVFVAFRGISACWLLVSRLSMLFDAKKPCFRRGGGSAGAEALGKVVFENDLCPLWRHAFCMTPIRITDIGGRIFNHGPAPIAIVAG